MKKPVLLIDISFIMHQARTTLPDLSTKAGINTGLLYGTLARLASLMQLFETNRVILCCDSKRSFRKEIYPEYKGKRNNIPEQELAEKIAAMRQFPKVLKQLKKIGFCSFESDGLEGDDIFASLVQNNKHQFIMVTPDQDMFQLLENKRVSMYSPQNKKHVSERWLMTEKRVTPKQWGVVKALGGCTSDNVQGLVGIGEVKAIQWIRGEIKDTLKAYKTINDGLDEIELYKRLVILPFKGTPVFKVPSKFKYRFSKFIEICLKYELASFLQNQIEWDCIFNDVFEDRSQELAKAAARTMGL